MFVKLTVFFFALVALVNAIPLTKNNTVHPVVNNHTLPRSISNVTYSLPFNHIYNRTVPRAVLNTTKSGTRPAKPWNPMARGSPVGYRIRRADAVPKRRTNQGNLMRGLPNKLKPQVLEGKVQTRNPLRFEQGRRGLNMNKPAEIRDMMIDSQVLSQLQNLVDDIANLLRTAGNSDGVNIFLSQVNDLKTEVQNGTLDVDDLLNAVQAIIPSIMSIDDRANTTSR